MLPDPEHRFNEVVLGQEVVRPRNGRPFAWQDGTWRLTFPRPDVDRLEYLIGVDGAFAPDPGNALRASACSCTRRPSRPARMRR